MKKNKNKLWIFAAAAVVLIIAVIVVVLLLSNKKDAYRVIKIYEVEGTAFVQRDGIDDIEPYANMLLESGDTVRVDEGSMTLKLDEDKYIYVEPDTEFSLVAEGSSANSKTLIELKKGAITNEIQDKLSTESAYEVNTPNSTMAVRGTIFRVEVTFDENGVCYTKLSTLEGKVVSQLVYPDGTISDKEVLVGRGYEVIIYQDDEKTDYLTDVDAIDFSQLPQTVQEKFKEIIEKLMDELGEKKDDTETEADESTEADVTEDDSKQTTNTTEEETTEAQAREYTVTFMYNGAVFGTQVVEAGECATQPSLIPAATGEWDYDFTKPVEEDTTIQWK